MKENLLREARKLINILDRFGNCLVPAIEGQKETFAIDKLRYVVGVLETEYSMATRFKAN